MKSRARLVQSIVSNLERDELTADDKAILTEGVLDQAAINYLLVVSGAFFRIESFKYIKQFPNVDTKHFLEWIGGHPISSLYTNNANPLPEFDLLIKRAVNDDNAELLAAFADISNTIRLVIISQLQNFSTFEKINAEKICLAFRLIEGDEALQKALSFKLIATAITSGNLQAVRACPFDFTHEMKQYYVALAASHGKTDILRELILAKGIAKTAVKAWLESNANFAQLKLNYRLPEIKAPSDTVKTAMIEGNFEYISLLLHCLDISSNMSFDVRKAILENLKISNLKEFIAVSSLMAVLESLNNRTPIDETNLEWISYLITREYFSLVKPLLEKVVKDDNIGLFCTLHSDEIMRFISPSRRQQLFLVTAEADAKEIVSHLCENYSRYLEIDTVGKLRALTEDGNHPKLNRCTQLTTLLSRPFLGNADARQSQVGLYGRVNADNAEEALRGYHQLYHQQYNRQ